MKVPGVEPALVVTVSVAVAASTPSSVTDEGDTEHVEFLGEVQDRVTV